MKQFDLVVCGGTFDHFHKGHESLLKLAFSLGQKVIIGVTSDSYVKNLKSRIQNSEFIEPFEERKKAVLEFVKKEKVLNRVDILEIDNLFGPTLSKDVKIDAIVVSQDTKKGAGYINRKRKELGLKDLKILVSPFVKAQDGQLISSARIRNGEINREGKLYVNQSWLKKNLILPGNLRRELRRPLGVLFSKDDKVKVSDKLMATVGDVTTKKFNELKLNQQVSVIDFKVKRQKKFSDIRELGFLGSERIIRVNNPAGSITSDIFKACLTIWNKEKVIFSVDGEEDLAVLPLILTAPLRTVIFYGQPGEGIVKIEVSEEIKEIVYRLVNKFEMLK